MSNTTARKDIFHAVGDGNRRRIIELLAERPRTVGELAAELGIAQPSVSQHVTVLREVGLTASERRGTSTVVSLTPEPLRDVAAWCLAQVK
ncbi:helix-turn-helix transcriptional regulator [Salinibacterium sp. ZJ450]|uniref:ArsR/SmtB family transcription factor n=1 Tax=Salinibacterium sp. ZJ450 TaxID=2708338 RepID=UPI00141ECD66|nr:metalloregulator ArsR/SmtB family transcription factor [Salinibacterium sp. ZJ450]